MRVHRGGGFCVFFLLCTDNKYNLDIFILYNCAQEHSKRYFFNYSLLYAYTSSLSALGDVSEKSWQSLGWEGSADDSKVENLKFTIFMVMFRLKFINIYDDSKCSFKVSKTD